MRCTPVRPIVPLLVALLTAGCHLAYHHTGASRGPLVLGGAQPLVAVTLMNAADPRGISGPPIDLALAYQHGQLVSVPIDGPALASLRAALAATAAMTMATPSQLLEVDTSGVSTRGIALAAFAAPPACPAGDVPRPTDNLAACVSNDGAHVAAVRLLSSSCGRLAQVLHVQGAEVHTDAPLVPLPEGAASPARCAVHDDGALLLHADTTLTALDATGRVTAQRPEPVLHSLAPVGAAAYATLRQAQSIDHVVHLDSALAPGARTALPREGQYDPVVLTSHGEHALVVRAHDGLITAIRIDERGTIATSTIDLTPQVPPVVK